MPELINYQDLARRYGLEQIPQSVQQLTQLLSRQDADIDEVARVISKDAGLSKRLLRAANPSAESEADYDIDSVDQALMRNGLGCALLLAMGTPLANALVKTFHTMLGLKLESTTMSAVAPLEGQHVLGTIGFAGKAAGSVYLRISLDSAAEITGRILGMERAQITDPSEIHDTVGELLNIMTGNFKSNLCDAGLDCRLQPPTVTHAEAVVLQKSQGSSAEQMTFRSGEIVLFVDLLVNPWNEQ